jgi:hypothetical protein
MLLVNGDETPSLRAVPAAITAAAPVNYAPSFTAGPSPISVAEGSGSFSAAWATAISAGPGDDEELRLAIDCDDAAAALFAAGPAISSGGVLSFMPAAHKSGSSRCSVSLAEAGGSGLSANASLVIVITPGVALAGPSVCKSKENIADQQFEMQGQQIARQYGALSLFH